MAWTEISKGTSKFNTIKGKVKIVYRGAFGTYNTRGEIAKAIHGDAGAKVTREDMENFFGVVKGNNFIEMSKGSSNWEET